jgi:hypothetical protein
MYYAPRIGRNYKKTRLLLISESAYSWRDKGRLRHPARNHPTNSVNFCIGDFQHTAKYFQRITRAICGKREPSQRERADAWDDYAYSIFIPGTVGEGAGGRRTKGMWEGGERDFWKLIEKLKPTPTKVVITSLTAWSKMRPSDVHLTDTLQAYRVGPSGSLMWCLAVPHPASRKHGKGFRTLDIAEQIALFQSAVLPRTWRGEPST